MVWVGGRKETERKAEASGRSKERTTEHSDLTVATIGTISSSIAETSLASGSGIASAHTSSSSLSSRALSQTQSGRLGERDRGAKPVPRPQAESPRPPREWCGWVGEKKRSGKRRRLVGARSGTRNTVIPRLQQLTRSHPPARKQAWPPDQASLSSLLLCRILQENSRTERFWLQLYLIF